jgi:bifunctional ADP-heptose synthase (sugar kinase/adenylyltransferase)
MASALSDREILRISKDAAKAALKGSGKPATPQRDWIAVLASLAEKK